MSADRLDDISRIVEKGISAGGFPGAAVVVGHKGVSVLQRGYGRLDWASSSPSVSPSHTIYDLASLTKVIGTTTAIMILFDQGRVSLDAPVSRYLPEFSGGEKSLVTVRQLLTHRSGLPAGRDIWRITHDPAEARRIILDTPLQSHPGEYYEYSDLGADVLGYIVEAVSGQPLDEFLQDYVFHPLGMYDTGFRPDASLRDRIAPTEVSPPRGYPLQGEVHDENAFAMGGVAGHAGLFSTAADLSVFAEMMLSGGEYKGVRIIADSTVQLFTTRAAGHRALGWDTPTGSYGSGHYLSPSAYGHTGYTGTSIWIDPERDMFVVLLTNRVHEARARNPLKVIGDVRSDLSDAASLAVNEGENDDIAVDAVFRADSERGWNASRRSLARGRGRHAKSLSSKHGHAGTSARSSKHGSTRHNGSSKHGSGKHTSSKRRGA
jgi:CubicO group peptidase (beta-lactamase class C family)